MSNLQRVFLLLPLICLSASLQLIAFANESACRSRDILESLAYADSTDWRWALIPAVMIIGGSVLLAKSRVQIALASGIVAAHMLVRILIFMSPAEPCGGWSNDFSDVPYVLIDAFILAPLAVIGVLIFIAVSMLKKRARPEAADA